MRTKQNTFLKELTWYSSSFCLGGTTGYGLPTREKKDVLFIWLQDLQRPEPPSVNWSGACEGRP